MSRKSGTGPNLCGLDHAAAELVALHRLEERLEVAFAEAFVALALDELEEYRPELRLREDLQEQPPLAVLDRAVDEDAALLQRTLVLAMAGQPLLQHLVIRLRRRRHQWHARRSQTIHRRRQIVGEQRDVLDALAVVLHQELLDLPGRLRRFLVERDADLAVGRRHRLRREPGVLALDVEVADL